MVISYDEHISDSDEAAIVRTQPISYQLIVSGAAEGESSKHYAEIARAVFNHEGLQAREVASFEEAEKEHVLIRVSLPTRREASAQDMLTAMTLFLLPTKTTRKSYYIYEIMLWQDKELKTTHRVVFDETTYLGLIFLPVFWVNLFTGEELNRDFEKALETVLQKAHPTGNA